MEISSIFLALVLHVYQLVFNVIFCKFLKSYTVIPCNFAVSIYAAEEG